MIEREITIGQVVDSRFIAMFIQKASRYNCSVYLVKDERRANAKSLLGLLSLKLSQGSDIMLVLDGDGEANAAIELEHYFLNGSN